MLVKVPFYRPYLTGKELTCVKEALAAEHWYGDGVFSEKCAQHLAHGTSSQVFMTPSGSAALELAFMALDLPAGSEVISPSFTFASSANAVIKAGLVPVFIDIREDTLNINEELIEQAITQNTRAILVVHYGGIAANMDMILALAKKYQLRVVEDAAQCINACYKDEPLGALGDLGILSFHQTKNITSGEGGALIVGNSRFTQRVEVLRQKGTDRSRFLRGEVDRYSWVECGSNYLMADLLAAFLYPQLQAMEAITEKRQLIYEQYYDALAPLQKENYRLPIIPLQSKSNYHIFYILFRRTEERDRVIGFLRRKGVEATTHFEPLHNSEGGRKYGVVRGPMNVTEMTAKSLMRLPLYTQMSTQEQSYVIQCVQEYFEMRGGA